MTFIHEIYPRLWIPPRLIHLPVSTGWTKSSTQLRCADASLIPDGVAVLMAEILLPVSATTHRRTQPTAVSIYHLTDVPDGKLWIDLALHVIDPNTPAASALDCTPDADSAALNGAGWDGTFYRSVYSIDTPPTLTQDQRIYAKVTVSAEDLGAGTVTTDIYGLSVDWRQRL